MGIIAILIASLLLIIFTLIATPLSPFISSNQSEASESSKPLYQESIEKAKDATSKVEQIENQQKQQIDNLWK